MKIVIVCKSDSTGGAAVVSRRLMESMRESGIDARMLVAEKLSDSPFVELMASPWRLKLTFIADRLPIALANGFKRSTLFQLDAASSGIDLSGHPLVREADAVCLNWVNQGVMSLGGVEKLVKMGKRVIWTMHDMWNFTGLCHHAGECSRYEMPLNCGNCPLLGKGGYADDLSHRVSLRKQKLYEGGGIDFVTVSSWLARKADGSTLLHGHKMNVIPNAFPLDPIENLSRSDRGGKMRLIFGAARLDDEIKGFPVLIEAMRALQREWPELASRTELTLFGGIKDATLLEQIAVKFDYKGVVRDPELVKRMYLDSDVVISTSKFETLPGTLIEGQAYGCLPVAFDRGGQRDIVEHANTGWLAEWSADEAQAGRRIAAGIAWADGEISAHPDLHSQRLYTSVKGKFSPEAVVESYRKLIGC